MRNVSQLGAVDNCRICDDNGVHLHVGISADGKFMFCITRWMYSLNDSDKFKPCHKG